MAVLQVLGQLPGLRNLCLGGCPLAAASSYQNDMLEVCATISILDGKHVEGRSKRRRPPAPSDLDQAIEPMSGKPSAKRGVTSDQHRGQGPTGQPRVSPADGGGGYSKQPAEVRRSSKQMQAEAGREAAVPSGGPQQKPGKRQKAEAKDAAPAALSDSLQRQGESKPAPPGQQLQAQAGDADFAPKSKPRQQQAALQAHEPMPAVDNLVRSQKKRRLAGQSHAAAQGGSSAEKAVKEQQQFVLDQPAAAPTATAGPTTASEAGLRQSQKPQHTRVAKFTISERQSSSLDDEDRVVELQPRALSTQANSAQSGIFRIIEANSRPARADHGVQQAAGRPKRDRSKEQGHQHGSHAVTRPITGAAAAQLLLKQAIPASAVADDLPGW